MPRFGMQLPNFTFGGVPDDGLFEHVAQLAVTAEDAGFSSLWVMDHFWQLPPLGGPDQPMLEGYTLLGGLAARTRTASLGTLVTGVTYRNPALVAKTVTTLDIVSSGRAVLGMGAAWYEEEHQGLGFDFPRAGERLDRLEEALRICRAMFTEARPSFTGRYYSIDEARNFPRPVQPGGPPIMVGGSGERRTLRLVAEHADLCNIFGSPATVRRLLDVLAGHCAAVDRDPTTISNTWLGTLLLTGSAAETERITEIVRGGGGEVEERFLIGEPSAVVDRVGG
ncbi:MAG: LLM class F420-dependent oxidoreductase, partial [Acidimicrobiia bacterium]